ncbi:HesA/MoeB/ThiF family protein [Desulfovibrio inopinatus]|uniref:HesA/MoeB/ThiF family protein n=1 Tax=Desulfovibrio inopinatus TaxID=102109 RepID=UPI0003F606F5|nr:ThiF family adenylyltransferase [Desulfovibrio inopinatus]
MKRDTVDLERFHKQALVPHIGDEGMQKLFDATVLILGLGGGGSAGAHQFALSNVGRIILCDHDIVEYSNLGRQFVHTDQTVGMKKVDSAKAYLEKANPGIDIEVIPEKVSTEILEDVYSRYKNILIYVSIDKWNMHYLINEFCIRNKIPAVHMGSLGFKAFVYTYDPNNSQVCFECMMRKAYIDDTDTDKIDATDANYAYLAPVISIAGSIAVTEGIKLLMWNSDKSTADSFIMYRGINHADILEPSRPEKPLIEHIFADADMQCTRVAQCSPHNA